MALFRTIIAAIAIVLLSTSASAEPGCTIVYGANWAFLFETPEAWVAACGFDKQLGVPVALWPRGLSFSAAPEVMYINIVAKSDPAETAEHFAQADLESFKTKSPPFTVSNDPEFVYAGGKRAIVRHLTPESGGNHELIAYLDARTVFAIIAVSARNADALAAAHSAFRTLVEGFVPMEKK